MARMSNDQIMKQANEAINNTIYIEMNKDCGEASNKIFLRLSDEEKSQMQKIMRAGCKMEDGTYAVENCELTRKMFAGFYKFATL